MLQKKFHLMIIIKKNIFSSSLQGDIKSVRLGKRSHSSDNKYYIANIDDSRAIMSTSNGEKIKGIIIEDKSMKN